ncbi:Holliday junction branch migration protein RuvA [Pseudonocardia acaciae]|uniref:Holliday junction branch migration protein RuvA n=1 Tax=Pseudonocardia acaciae TaxID=551276 RepID=UPI000491C5CC|nr:Holliday junction branch migration protein RuvA [Pseudonocardia acaciae]
MISSVRGPVLAIGLDHAVIEVGGVGLAVHATPATLATLRRGEQAQLATSLIVREDSLTLYGFADTETSELFGLLQTVTGVGPRLALATLAVLEPDALRQALADGDLKALTRVPGIGRKGAERLVVELRDKVTAAPTAPATNGTSTSAGVSGRDHVVEALVGLGFAAKQAEQTVDAVFAESNGNGVDTSAALRAALNRLGASR